MGLGKLQPGCNCCDTGVVCADFIDMGTNYPSLELTIDLPECGVSGASTDCAALSGTYFLSHVYGDANRARYEYEFPSPVATCDFDLLKITVLFMCNLPTLGNTYGACAFIDYDSIFSTIHVWDNAGNCDLSTGNPGWTTELPLSGILFPLSVTIGCKSLTNASFQLL